jgi:hypothetical protein
MKITTTEGWALFVSGFTNLEHCSISMRNSFRISVGTSDFSVVPGLLHQWLYRELDVCPVRNALN